MILQVYGWLSKLWSLFGSLLEYGTYYLGYPKKDPNFHNYPDGFLFSLCCSWAPEPAFEARLRQLRPQVVGLASDTNHSGLCFREPRPAFSWGQPWCSCRYLSTLLPAFSLQIPDKERAAPSRGTAVSFS